MHLYKFATGSREQAYTLAITELQFSITLSSTPFVTHLPRGTTLLQKKKKKG